MLAAATTAYAWVNNSAYDDELDELIVAFRDARDAVTQEDRTVDGAIAITKMRSYLSHFVGNTTYVDVVSVGLLYTKVLPGLTLD